MTSESRLLLESEVSLPDRTLWFGCAELSEQGIRITGWTWTGRYDEFIDLGEVNRIETWTRSEGANVLVHTSGTTHLLRLKSGVMRWHWKLKELGLTVEGQG